MFDSQGFEEVMESVDKTEGDYLYLVTTWPLRNAVI